MHNIYRSILIRPNCEDDLRCDAMITSRQEDIFLIMNCDRVECLTPWPQRPLDHLAIDVSNFCSKNMSIQDVNITQTRLPKGNVRCSRRSAQEICFRFDAIVALLMRVMPVHHLTHRHLLRFPAIDALFVQLCTTLDRQSIEVSTVTTLDVCLFPSIRPSPTQRVECSATELHRRVDSNYFMTTYFNDIAQDGFAWRSSNLSGNPRSAPDTRYIRPTSSGQSILSARKGLAFNSHRRPCAGTPFPTSYMLSARSANLLLLRAIRGNHFATTAQPTLSCSRCLRHSTTKLHRGLCLFPNLSSFDQSTASSQCEVTEKPKQQPPPP